MLLSILSVASLFLLWHTQGLSTASPLAGNHNCHGSALCGILDNSVCVKAYQGYSDLGIKNLTAYTAFVAQQSGGTGGCTAMYRCSDDKSYEAGIMGQTLYKA
jgi:hypothetical protein